MATGEVVQRLVEVLRSGLFGLQNVVAKRHRGQLPVAHITVLVALGNLVHIIVVRLVAVLAYSPE
jgi:hypothetical protein